ncbi:Alkaline phosphatase synthesis sensor protein phoR [uncultured Eubacterium sp.]|nr:Alkaline phosphatase synthesis sensor protein phoR [uncultured Eubacterium sp.]
MKTEKSLSKRLSRQLMLRMIIALIIYTFIGIAGYLAAILIFGLFTWQTENPIYQLANWAQLRQQWFALLYFGVGYFLIIRHYWSQPFRYFQEVVDATKSVASQDDNLVTLPPQLSELEGELNQIKMTALNNQRAAREAEQRKNDLVTYLAHDLKTPITSVIGYLTLLHDEQQISEEMRQRYLAIALDKAERLDDLINEFFEITRFNLSHISLEKKQINLSLMLDQLLYEFQPMLKGKQLECQLNVPEGIMMRCDPDKLQRVFDNLLRNAVNYSFENSSIRITAKTGINNVLLTFENDGDTISQEKLSRIFEQFYRLDTSRSSGSGGAGLGLAIAKEIVELHGGTIRAFSENDIIRFDVSLPLS